MELGIPEDDPPQPCRNRDNVGDNVGDVAGMGADLFDSNVAAMASALVIAESLAAALSPILPWYSATPFWGCWPPFIGIATAKIGKNGNPTHALNSSTYVTTGIFLVLTAIATAIFDGFSWRIPGERPPRD